MKNLSKELFDDVDFRLKIAYAATKLDKIKEKEDSSNDIAEYVYSMLELIEQKYKFKRDDLFVSFIFTDWAKFTECCKKKLKGYTISRCVCVNRVITR